MFICKRAVLTNELLVKVMLLVYSICISTNKAGTTTPFPSPSDLQVGHFAREPSRSHAAGSTLKREVISESPGVRGVLPETPVSVFIPAKSPGSNLKT